MERGLRRVRKYVRRMRQIAVSLAALTFLGGIFLFGRAGCVAEREEVRAAGTSLHGIFASGEEAALLRGYYACRKIQRGDVVAYQYAPGRVPFVKMVRGVPGDTVAFQPARNLWHLVINGAVVTTAQGEPYLLDQPAVGTIRSYVEGSGGAVPNGLYLLLGNLPAGTFDSTRFGLVAAAEIVGKLIPR